MKPYSEKKVGDSYHRLFKESLEFDDLVWHRDAEDRIILAIENTNWMIQLDNELPQNLNSEFYIPKETYHRLIKGTGDLNLIIKKIK